MSDNTSVLGLASPTLKPFLQNVSQGRLSAKVYRSATANAQVVKFAGAWPRDPVDTRVVGDIAKKTGKLIFDPSEVGGWPVLKSAPAPADADKDGMPDAWETKKGLNPQNAADRNQDRDLDGLTELEEYLHERTLELKPQ
jgi:hypothetical protein